MEIQIIGEYGYRQAMQGLALSYKTTIKRAMEIAPSLSKKDHGHNKFLEHIDVWLMVRAERDWWQEADTYRLSTKQSESTMHTIHKRLLKESDFEEGVSVDAIVNVNAFIWKYQRGKSIDNLMLVKRNLPEGFLQEREWKLSYKNIREILIQRYDHKHPCWREVFCPYIMKNVKHPELLPLF